MSSNSKSKETAAGIAKHERKGSVSWWTDGEDIQRMLLELQVKYAEVWTTSCN